MTNGEVVETSAYVYSHLQPEPLSSLFNYRTPQVRLVLVPDAVKLLLTYSFICSWCSESCFVLSLARSVL